jgi:hypothetical protein
MATVQITRQHHEIAAHVLRVLAEQGESAARLIASDYMKALITDTRKALTVGKKDLPAIRKAMLLITGDTLIGKELMCPEMNILRPYYVVKPYSLVPAPIEVKQYQTAYNSRVDTALDNRTQISSDDVMALKLYCQGVLSHPFTPIMLNKLVRNDPNEISNKGELLKYLYAIALCSGRRFWEELLFLSEFEPVSEDSFRVLGVAKDSNKKEEIFELSSLFVDPKVWIQRLAEIRAVVDLNDWKDATQASNSCAQYINSSFRVWFHNISHLINVPSDCRDLYANICYQRSRLYDAAMGSDATGDKLIFCGKALVHVTKTNDGKIQGDTSTAKSYMAYNVDMVSLEAIEN